MLLQNTFNIPAILGVGITGLGFLLALLAYYLLHKEQGKQRPNKSILNSVYIFMAFSILLVFIGLTSEYIKQSSSAQLDENKKRADICCKDAENLKVELSNIKTGQTQSGNQFEDERKEWEQKLRDAETQISKLKETIYQSSDIAKIKLSESEQTISDQKREITSIKGQLVTKDTALGQNRETTAALEQIQRELNNLLNARATAIQSLINTPECSENGKRVLEGVRRIQNNMEDALTRMKTKTQK